MRPVGSKKTKRDREQYTSKLEAWLPRKKASLAVVLLVGLACGYLLATYRAGREPLDMIETRPGGYEFINPLLECDMAQEPVGRTDFLLMRQKVRDLIEAEKKRPGVSHISVYYRDLNNGPWLGIDERVMFSPASLLKVPFTMALLKEAETNPGFLQKKLTYTDMADTNAREHFKPSKFILWGKQYTVDELIRHTVAYSDNNAYFLLLRHFPQEKLIKVYTELGVPVPYDNKGEDIMSVKDYAAFFRILFNASYLNREMSTKALQYLSQSDFESGIVAGVPSSVRVAHKFGERTLGPAQETKQLHDCGIVYYPEHPYLLCVMTRGSSFELLTDVITKVSAAFYKELAD